jgi:hypothetical protein
VSRTAGPSITILTTKPAKSKPKFFFGAEAFFQVSFKDYRIGSNKLGVKAYLSKVFVTGKGERLSYGGSAPETFGAYCGTVSGVNPTVGMDDNIPF